MPRDLLDDVQDLHRGRLRRPVVLEDGRAPEERTHPAIERPCPTCGAEPGMACVTVGGATANGGRVPNRGGHGSPTTPHTTR